MENNRTSISFDELLRRISTIAQKEVDHIEESATEESQAEKEAQQPSPPDYQNEEYSLEREQWREIHERCEDVKANRELRKEYASKVYVFMCIWCGLVFLIVILDALTYTPTNGSLKDLSFQLSPPVLTTLIGGTTVSVIGLVGFMMQGLFRSNGSKDTKDNNTK